VGWREVCRHPARTLPAHAARSNVLRARVARASTLLRYHSLPVGKIVDLLRRRAANAYMRSAWWRGNGRREASVEVRSSWLVLLCAPSTSWRDEFTPGEGTETIALRVPREGVGWRARWDAHDAAEEVLAVD
jgi:hypothetical protein